MTKVANPSVEEAIRAVVAIIESSSEFPIEDAYKIFDGRYRSTFQARLDESKTAWDDDHERLFEVAYQHGVIATAMARLNKDAIVKKKVFERSCDVVQKECHDITPRGQWCGGR